jgi:hypothetical protein
VGISSSRDVDLLSTDGLHEVLAGVECGRRGRRHQRVRVFGLVTTI